jgi:hypothetical protein
MEASSSSETSVTMYQATLRHIPCNNNLQCFGYNSLHGTVSSFNSKYWNQSRNSLSLWNPKFITAQTKARYLILCWSRTIHFPTVNSNIILSTMPGIWRSRVQSCRLSQLIQNNKKFWEEIIAYFPWYDTGHIEDDASNNSSIVAFVFVTAVMFLPSRCLAKIGRFLLNRCLATIGGLLLSPCLATIGEFLPSRCLATIGGIHRHTHRQQRDLISLFYFFQNKESRLKKGQQLKIGNDRFLPHPFQVIIH